MKIQAQDSEFDTLVISTNARHREKIGKFIDDNYGMIVRRDCWIRDDTQGNYTSEIDIFWPYNAVGTDVLIRFIAELEFAEGD
jgi:hypothetical protein